MTAHTVSLGRRPFEGVCRIARLNWPRYLLAGVIVLLTGISMAFELPHPVRVALWGGASLALFWSIMSLIGSHLVYDRSDLFTWRWMRDVLDAPPTRWINIHAGLDSIGRPVLRKLFPRATGLIVDIFDPAEMTEPSIGRAQGDAPADPHTLHARFDHLPMQTGDADLALLALAAHELRSDESREAFFHELRRVIRPGGTLVLVEHVRNAANFIAFGPGAFHFYSRRTWLRTATATGFTLARELSFTPLVRALILRRAS